MWYRLKDEYQDLVFVSIKCEMFVRDLLGRDARQIIRFRRLVLRGEIYKVISIWKMSAGIWC